MKTINKLMGIMLCVCILAVFSVSETWAVDSASGYSKTIVNICLDKAKIAAKQLPDYNDSSKIKAYNTEALCNCKKYTNKDKNNKTYIYPNDFYVALDFPNAARCETKRFNGWETGESYCSGFPKESFSDMSHKTKKYDSSNHCWKWECGENYERGEKDTSICRPICDTTKTVRNPDDETQCIAKSENTEYSGDTNSTSYVQITPCDEKSTITVTLNGVKKTVQANTRIKDACVPTCQSDMASSIDTDDETEFVIYLNK